MGCKPKSMIPVPADGPGVDNSLKTKLEDAVVKAMDEEGTNIYAFGERWGPEKDKADKYFGFKPGNGIHDIHMNQGNDGKWRRDNGTHQDGALFIEYPDNKWRAFFFAFQSQTLETDDDGHPVVGAHPSLLASGGGRRTSAARGSAKTKPVGNKANARKAKKSSKKAATRVKGRTKNARKPNGGR